MESQQPHALPERGDHRPGHSFGPASQAVKVTYDSIKSVRHLRPVAAFARALATRLHRCQPDGLWEIAEPLIPPSKVRPQGGGTQDTPDETLFAAIIYVLVSGCAWRALPPCFRDIEVDRAPPVPDLVAGRGMGPAA
ncbi:hypothetical protein GCM10017771_93920 [Streptomyces capitiformicae]|uniref:Insertion element IS402-like domain-containing protein n=1 Tax=Streptomyces capitiformicae TaxID=2014920 RepID=A0A918ZVD3_9ACTN|nr:hypothetical protein GCM10017771_93920 [Streptomyces capitiformicae]